ncbi:potassium/sodium hyperpolarization-activated cyclic nucleotide-gated channel 1-like [Toxorhynchites rutilus septentrionalis]|uniref:potassium/sodium hyperpolarization-activated cyclic nucleotide-gated channel 1-like n=1 Tax=Toxorhynchites rutilus septentrionalis TaxID=329112 RepID=UPI00247A589D|nr:potassium/sodium hyperpolarization-activated cyclic nucleotide-gated channel 1-like [Toxorhynchites rutilus septentrionalis]
MDSEPQFSSAFDHKKDSEKRSDEDQERNLEDHEKIDSRKGPPAEFPKHECTIGHGIDLLKAFVPGESLRKRITRCFRRICYLDPRSALSREVFCSDTAMKREISRNISFYASIIHPFSYLRFCWECVMILTFAVAFIVLPYDVIFLYQPEEYYTMSLFHMVVLAVDFVCLVDICFNIRTGFYDKHRQYVELDSRIIANRYLAMWFWIDLISSAPDGLFSRYIVPKHALQYSFIDCLHRRELHFGCFWDFWKVLSILKMFRLQTFLRYISNVYRRYGLRRNVMKFTTIATIIVVSLHWTSCLMFLVARFVQGTDPDLVDPQSWTKKTHFWNETSSRRYFECLYRSLHTVGLITHTIDQFMTNEDILMVLAATVFGYVLKIYVLAELLIFIRILFSSTSMYHEHRHELQNYIRYEQFLPELGSRMLCYYDNRLMSKKYGRKKLLDKVTSDQFEADIREDICGELLSRVSLFRMKMEPEMMKKLLMALEYQFYMKDDVVVNASLGVHQAKMVFVIRGTVAVYTSNWREVLHLEDGEHFGEYQLVLEGDYMKYSNIVAVEISEVYTLAKTDFDRILAEHPEVQETLTNLAKERYETLTAMERGVILQTIEEAETIRRTKKLYE